MRTVGRVLVAAAVTTLVALFVFVVVSIVNRHAVAEPGCTVALPGDATYAFSPEQTRNAATITAVGLKRGLPPHAATVALATAMQESKLLNLPGGDRDSVGLFQQRPSQGWGAPDQLLDPVYAAGEFYQKLVELPEWQTMPITEAAQQVQRSAAPDAYAQWEPQARALAAVLNGQFPAALTCRAIAVGTPRTDIVAMANAQLGSAVLSGPHPADQGWAIAGWLVAHAQELGVDEVRFAGQLWTAASGTWNTNPQAGPDLSLHQVPVPAPIP